VRARRSNHAPEDALQTVLTAGTEDVSTSYATGNPSQSMVNLPDDLPTRTLWHGPAAPCTRCAGCEP
jgi:hypothetical protein